MDLFNFSLKSCISVISALLSLLVFTPQANATLYLYTIPSTNFALGGTLSGSFQWDQVGAPINVDLTTSASSPYGGIHYTSGSLPSGTTLVFNSGIGTLTIAFDKFTSPQNLINASEVQSGINKGNARNLSFLIVGVPVVVPEPSTYALLAGGLSLGALVMARRKKSVV